MNQCVPSWDIDDGSLRRPTTFNRSISSNSSALDVPSLDNQVAELTWENGQLAMHGLAPPRVANKPPNGAWAKPRAGGTLESIVDQATGPQRHVINELAPWFDHVTMTMDALVPSGDKNVIRGRKNNSAAHVVEMGGTCVVGPAAGVGSCSGAAGGRDDSRQVDTWERELCGGGGMTSTSMWSPENTSSGKEYTRTSGEDLDSACHSRSQKEAGDAGKRKRYGEPSVSTKKSRAAAIHNQSERKRRDKINQRMKTLQKMVPNSSKTDKASMLDEVIEYLKQLQAQVHMMSRMNMPSMMMPLAMQQQQIQMSMMGMGMSMGTMGPMGPMGPMGGLMDLNSIRRATSSMVPPAIATSSWDMMNQHDRLHSHPALNVMPDLLSTFLASQSQSQPMTMDAYSRMAAFYQQFQQPPNSGPKN